MNFFKRFGYALEGMFYLFTKDKNFILHLSLFGVLLAFGFFFHLNASEWASVLLCSALVLGLEAVNTAIERLADRLHPEIHPEIKIVKDVASGAVLLAAIFSAVIACIIFLPKIACFFAAQD